MTLDLPAQVPGKKPDPFLPFKARYQTGADGAFNATHLPEGIFQICAIVPNSDYIENCRWQQGPGNVSLSVGQSLQFPPMSLKKGYRMKIRVNDAAGVLTHTTAQTFGSGLIIGMFTQNGLFVGARPVAADAGGFDLDVLVPFDTPVHFSAYSKSLKLTDGAGKVADAISGIHSPVTVPSGTAAPPAITVTVTGVVAAVKP